MKLRTTLAALAALVLSATTAVHAAMTGSGDVYDYTYQGSRARDYTVYVPQSYDGSTPVPMVFALHGCAMDHDDARSLWNFDLIADQHNVIVVFPFVTSFSEMRNENCWGYWFDNHVQEGGGGEVDDLHGMAQQVEANYNIDPDRRYITGISSGGGMTVAAAIAYNEYWAAAAPVEGLPYGDWSSSVTADMFQDLQTHIDKINAELDYERAVPTLVIQSSNDTVVMPEAMRLIRDSQLSVWGPDLNADATADCSAEGINCTLTTYNDAAGNPLVQTLYYDGLIAEEASYGHGHYWTGDDENQAKWAKETGPSASQHIWNFFSQVSMSGYGPPPACDSDSSAPAAPTGLAPSDVHDTYAVLNVNANGESDLQGYRIYRAGGTALTPSAVASETITVSGLSAETQYQVYATAVDQCGNESAPSATVSFTTTALEYIAPSETGTCTEHYNAGRLSVSEYTACGNEHGYMSDVTLWQLEDGSWTDEDPNGGSGGGGGGGGGSDPEPGSWTTNASQAGMEVHIYTPTTTTANGKRALMVALHGCSQSNEVVRDNWSWEDEADEYGMVIAAPMAPNGGVIAGCWDYYDSNHSRANPGRHDDNLIDLAQALLADSKLNIDPDQVYISGLSSGGGETFVMGCVAPEIFAGIGINAGPAVGTSSGQIGSAAVSAAQAASTCQSFADDGNQAGFDTQLTSVVHGTSDYTVGQDYAEVDAQAMANVYGASKDSGSNAVSGGGTEETWSDSSGVRVSKIMVSGLGHAWPAGSDSSGGSYTDHATIDYPAFLTAFFFEHNRRADFGSGDQSPPAVPTGLAVTGATNDSITLAWNAVGDADLDYYTLYKDGSIYTTSSATTITVTGLATGSSYSFAVSATDTAGNESSLSGTVQGATQTSGGGDTAAPAVPSGLAVVGASESSLSLDWSDNGESDLVGYEVYLDGSLLTTTSSSAYTYTGLSAGTSYTLAVAAYDSSGNSSARATLQASTDQEPPSYACTESTASNYSHVGAGRAYVCNSWYTCATGSGENMGLYNTYTTTTLAQTAEGYYEIGSCP